MTPKALFLQNADASKTMLGIVNHRHFQLALMHAKSQWIDNAKPGSDKVEAVAQFIDVLMDLPVEETQAAGLPAPSLHQDLDTIDRKPKPRTAKKKVT